MAEARRKIEQEERKEILEYCMVLYNNYNGTVSHYESSHIRVCCRFKKYMKNVDVELEGKRYLHKSDDKDGELLKNEVIIIDMNLGRVRF